jgi:hypothetical protein
VVDPVARTVTHLVVEPKHRQGLGRLVPLELIDASKGGIRLRATIQEFEQLEDAEETEFLLGTSSDASYGPGQGGSGSYYGLGGDMGLGMGDVAQPIIYDKVPLGEVAVRRGEHVHATDGDIGRVQGLVIDSQDHHVTHVLLQEGHFWGRKQVAIPIGAVIGVDDGIRLNITKHQVQALSPVAVDRGDG